MNQSIGMKVIIAVLLVMIFAGCVGWTSLPEESKGGAWMDVDVWVDDKTGVEYVVFETKYGVGVCPRYNADGILMIKEK